MIIDALLQFSDAQALTASGASTNVVDLGVANVNYGDATFLGVVVTNDVAADFTTADETYTVKLQTDDNSAFSSPTDVGGVVTYTATTRALGGRIVLPLPMGVSMERYLRVYYTLGGTTPSITVSAVLQPLDMIDSFRTYADNSTIS